MANALRMYEIQSLDNLKQNDFSFDIGPFFKFFALQNILLQIFWVVIHFDLYEIFIVIPHYFLIRVHFHDVVVLIFPAKKIKFKLFVLSRILFDLNRSAHQMFF